LAGGVIACCSRTQSICVQSSTEAELITANVAAKVTKGLRFILHELGYTCQPRGPCASLDDVQPAGSECSVLICYSHNSHSLFNYSVDS